MLLDYAKEMVLKWEVSIGDIIYTIKFLRKFGYLKPKYSIKEIIQAVKDFQKIVGLKTIDGEIGPKTLRAINKPRCGCPDHFILEAREAINRWGTHDLTWKILARDNDLSLAVWDNTIKLSLQQWANVADLSFTEVGDTNNAKLLFSVGSSRREGFGSRGGTLAWAYLPPRDNFDGQLLCKFDTAETWVTEGNGIHLLNVACHEVGHLLGLRHSSVQSALMAPYYNQEVSKPKENDDVSRIQSLYGPVIIPEPPAPEPPAPKPPTPEPPTDKLEIKVEGEITKVEIPGYRVTKL